VPLAAFLPVQLPEAVHEVALVEDQVTIEILPEVMLVGLAESATVGVGVRQGLALFCARAGAFGSATTRAREVTVALQPKGDISRRIARIPRILRLRTS
jgi:hypothetical protein